MGAIVNAGGLTVKEIETFKYVAEPQLLERLEQTREPYDVHLALSDRDGADQKVTLRLFTKRFDPIVVSSNAVEVIDALREVAKKSFDIYNKEREKHNHK